MTKSNPENEVSNTIVQAKSHTIEELLGNWEVALKGNSKSVIRGKKWMKIGLASIAFDIVLTFGFFYNTIEQHEETQRAAVATCISGNKARTDNRHLWDYVVNLIDKNGKPSQAIVKFEEYLNDATTPRVCE